MFGKYSIRILFFAVVLCGGTGLSLLYSAQNIGVFSLNDSDRVAPSVQLAVHGQQDHWSELPVAYVQSLLQSSSSNTRRRGVAAARIHSSRYLFTDAIKRIVVEDTDFYTRTIAIRTLPDIESIPDIPWMEGFLYFREPATPQTESVKNILVESIGSYSPSNETDAFLKKAYASEDPQRRLAVVRACPKGASVEAASAILIDALQSTKFVSVAISAGFIGGGQLRHEAADEAIKMPMYTEALRAQLITNLKTAIKQVSEVEPDSEALTGCRPLLICLSKIPDEQELLFSACRQLLSSPHIESRRAVFEAGNAVGPILRPLESDFIQAISLMPTKDEDSQELVGGLESLASIGAASATAQELIVKAQHHPRLGVRLAACCSACYLKLRNLDSRMMIQNVISIEPTDADFSASVIMEKPLAQIALETMPPKEAVRYLREQEKLQDSMQKSGSLGEYQVGFRNAAGIIEKVFNVFPEQVAE